jgi:hypothetical protein
MLKLARRNAESSSILLTCGALPSPSRCCNTAIRTREASRAPFRTKTTRIPSAAPRAPNRAPSAAPRALYRAKAADEIQFLLLGSRLARFLCRGIHDGAASDDLDCRDIAHVEEFVCYVDAAGLISGRPPTVRWGLGLGGWVISRAPGAGDDAHDCQSFLSLEDGLYSDRGGGRGAHVRNRAQMYASFVKTPKNKHTRNFPSSGHWSAATGPTVEDPCSHARACQAASSYRPASSLRASLRTRSACAGWK